MPVCCPDDPPHGHLRLYQAPKGFVRDCRDSLRVDHAAAVLYSEVLPNRADRDTYANLSEPLKHRFRRAVELVLIAMNRPLKLLAPLPPGEVRQAFQIHAEDWVKLIREPHLSEADAAQLLAAAFERIGRAAVADELFTRR